ncbi:hypothetical protein CMK11_13690 [Candidatus Poribacteria bacterium]|nr:hypothetical protein [Candidatus Poribacteria bacterium]
MSQTPRSPVFTIGVMAQKTDRALVTSALGGNAEAFADLVERYTRSVHALVYSRLLDHGDAQDATQETFLRAYRALGKLRHLDTFEAWLHRIALSCAYDRLRQRARETVTDVQEMLADTAVQSTAIETLERREDVMPLVRRALASLPDALRAPLLLRYLGDAPYEAIGRRLHISESAARKRVERGIARLREYVRRSGGDLSAHDLAVVVAPACPFPPQVAGEVRRLLRFADPPARGESGASAGRPTLAVAATCASLVTGMLVVGSYVADLARAPSVGGVVEGGTPVLLLDVEGVSSTPAARAVAVNLARQDYDDLTEATPLPGWTAGVEAAADPSGERGAGVAKVTTNLPGAYYEFPLTRGTVTVELWMQAAPAPDAGMRLSLGNALAGWNAGEDIGMAQALVTKNTSGPWVYRDGRVSPEGRVEFHGEDGRWHHVKAVYTTESNVYDLYFDDQLVGSRIRSATDLSAGVSAVGVNSGRWRYDDDIPSYFDDLRVTAITTVDDDPAGSPWIHGGPVLTTSPGAFDGKGVADPCVLFADGVYRMWYTGHREWNPARPQHSRMTHIGYATSADGARWEKRGVVLAPDDRGWDSHQVMAASVLQRGARYEMWYSANAAPKDSMGIGRATSRDGVRWTRDYANPVIRHRAAGNRQHPELGSVTFADGRYHMWYHATRATGERVVRYATSGDGSRWTEAGVALTPGEPGEWDASALRDAEVVRVGDRWEMWYWGAGQRSSGIGRATSRDGLVWHRDVANPRLTAGVPGHWTYPTVQQPSALYDGRQLRLWYVGGGSLRQIGNAFVHEMEHRQQIDDRRQDLISRVDP